MQGLARELADLPAAIAAAKSAADKADARLQKQKARLEAKGKAEAEIYTETCAASNRLHDAREFYTNLEERHTELTEASAAATVSGAPWPAADHPAVRPRASAAALVNEHEIHRRAVAEGFLRTAPE